MAEISNRPSLIDTPWILDARIEVRRDGGRRHGFVRNPARKLAGSGIPGCCQSESGDATFSAAGPYAIAVALNKGGGNGNLDFTVADSNENCLIGGGCASLLLVVLLGAGSLVRRAGRAV